MKVQNFVESLCIPLISSVPLILGNQRRCADLLFIITKSSTTKWAYTDIVTVALWLTLSLGTQWVDWSGRGYFAAQGDKLCSFFFSSLCYLSNLQWCTHQVKWLVALATQLVYLKVVYVCGRPRNSLHNYANTRSYVDVNVGITWSLSLLSLAWNMCSH